MRFISPRTDYAFKKIFGSENSKKILISFLNAILNFKGKNKIISLEILDPYSLPKIKGLKNSCVDVKVKTKCDKQIIIEMQIANEIGFDKRVLYNVAKQYANQIKSAEDYINLNPVIGITIADFVMFKEIKKYINYFIIKEKTEDFEYNGDIELVFVELSKFKKGLSELKSIQDKWLYFLQEAENLEVIPNELSQDKIIKEAFDFANRSNMLPEELDELEKREIFKAQEKNRFLFGVRMGEERGKQEGRQEGRQEEKKKNKEEKILMVKKMLKIGLDFKKIQNITNLSDEDLKNIK